ncbi:hypothetical protein VNO80_26713 [Phaseolus coccineus]|uniref:Uncharacterized protein n=1 Tax=Phaseolus coccineus TaxID=3886 RepID=A0AAN9LIT5_PHACN
MLRRTCYEEIFGHVLTLSKFKHTADTTFSSEPTASASKTTSTMAEDPFKNDEQHDDVDDQQLGDDFDVPIDDVEEEHGMSQHEDLGDAPEPPQVQIRSQFTA